MKIIGDQIKQITQDLGYKYDRSASLEETDILTHYSPAAEGYVIYTGFGPSVVTFEGANPVETVQVELSLITKKKIIDQKTEVSDIQNVRMHQLAADIIARFNGVESVSTYNLEPIYNRFDDLFLGYNLTFEAVIQGDVCSI